MTVTWIDTPGSTLASKIDVVDFSVTSEPAAISVSFGASRAEERAYRDGAFLYPYLSSTRNGATFALRRAGGWPRDPTIYVDEQKGGGYGVLLDLDFASMPAHTFTAGKNVVAGVEFWLKVDGAANPTGFSILPGAGLQVIASPTTLDSGNYYQHNNLRVGLYIPFDQAEGYAPDVPYQMQWRYAGAYQIGNWRVGIANLAGIASSARSTGPEHATGIGVELDDGARYRAVHPGGNNFYTSTKVGAIPWHVASLSYSPDSGLAWVKHHVLQTGWPDATVGVPEPILGTWNYRALNAAQKYGAYVYTENAPHVGTGVCTIPHLRILQVGAA